MSSVAAGLSWGKVFDITKDVLKDTGDMTKNMRFFNNETGLSSQRMRAWAMMAEQLGINSDDVAVSLKKLQSSIGRPWASQQTCLQRTR